MTAAHRPGAILTPRYRGARAVANFNAADARSRADRDADNRISARPPSRDITHCPGRSSARPAALFNAVSNERSPEPGRCLVSSEAPGCRGDAYTQPSPCEMTTHCMAKANAGAGGRHDCTHHSDRQRTARFAAVLCRLPRPFSSVVHGAHFCAYQAESAAA